MMKLSSCFSVLTVSENSKVCQGLSNPELPNTDGTKFGRNISTLSLLFVSFQRLCILVYRNEKLYICSLFYSWNYCRQTVDWFLHILHCFQVMKDLGGPVTLPLDWYLIIPFGNVSFTENIRYQSASLRIFCFPMVHLSGSLSIPLDIKMNWAGDQNALC